MLVIFFLGIALVGVAIGVSLALFARMSIGGITARALAGASGSSMAGSICLLINNHSEITILVAGLGGYLAQCFIFTEKPEIGRP